MMSVLRETMSETENGFRRTTLESEITAQALRARRPRSLSSSCSSESSCTFKNCLYAQKHDQTQKNCLGWGPQCCSWSWLWLVHQAGSTTGTGTTEQGKNINMTEVFATQSSTLGGHNSFPAFAPVPQPQQQVQVAGTSLFDVPSLNALTAVEQKAVAPDGNATAAPRDPSAEVPPPVVETPEQRRERALATLSEADIKSNGQIVQHIGEVALRGRVNFQQLSQLAQRYGIDPELFAEGVKSSPVAASTSTDFDDYNTLPGTRTTVTLCEYSEADLLVRILRLPPLLPYPLEQLTELQSRIQTGAFANAEEGLILQLLQILTREAEKEQTNPQGRRRARDSGPHFSAFSDALQDEYGTSILSLASKRGWLGVVEHVLNECVPAAGDEVETVGAELLERTELHLRADRATDADALGKELEKKRKTWLEQAAVRPAKAEKNAGGATGGTTSDSAAVPQPVLRIPPPDAGMTLPPGAGAPAAVPTSARSGGGTTKRVTFSEQPASTMFFGPNEGILNPAMAGSPFGGAGTLPALGAAPPSAPGADNYANPFNSFNNPNASASSFAPSPPAVESAAAAAPNLFGGPSSTALPLPSPFAPPVPTAAVSGATSSASTAPNPFAPSPSPFAPSPNPFAAPPNPFAPTNPTPAPDPNNPFAVPLPAASATAGAPPPSPFAPQEPPASPFGFATATGGTQPSHSQAAGAPTSTFPPQVQIQIPAPSTTIDSKAVISSAATTTGTSSSGGDGTTTSAGTIAGASEATPSSASTAAPPATYYNTAQFRENTQLLFDPHLNTHEFDCSPRRKLKASDRMVAYVNRPNRMGWTALLLAAQSGGPAVCKKLLDSRADVDVEASATKLTPLMVAGTRSSLAIVELLLNYRADVWKMNVVGQSVVEIVKNKKHMRDQKLKFARIGGTGSEEGVLDAKGKPMDLYGIGGPISLEEGKDLGAIEELLLRVTQGKELQKITPALNSSAAK